MSTLTAPAHATTPRLPVLAPRFTAAALVLGPLAFAVSDAAYAIATRNGGSDEKAADALALIADHPTLYRVSTVAAIVASLLLAPAALAAGQLAARRAPRLSAAGGVLMALGFMCYVGIAATGFVSMAIVEGGKGLEAFAAASDVGMAHPSAMWMFLLFVAGNMLGTLLLGIAMVRSRIVPRWAGIAVAVWPVFHITGLAVGVEWFEVTGALLIAAGFSQVARVLVTSADARG